MEVNRAGYILFKGCLLWAFWLTLVSVYESYRVKDDYWLGLFDHLDYSATGGVYVDD